MPLIDKSHINKEVLLFSRNFLCLSKNSLVACSFVFQEYKRFCSVHLTYPMSYANFRNSICEIDKQISCVKLKSRFYFYGVTLVKDSPDNIVSNLTTPLYPEASAEVDAGIGHSWADKPQSLLVLAYGHFWMSNYQRNVQLKIFNNV